MLVNKYTINSGICYGDLFVFMYNTDNHYDYTLNLLLNQYCHK